jgi:hypothetical protein
MTSFGDTFTQSYEAVVVDEDSKGRDRTCSAGPGSGSVKPSDNYLSAVCSWLDEAQKQLSSHTHTEPKVADAESTHVVDVLPYLDRKCSSVAVVTVKDEICLYRAVFVFKFGYVFVILYWREL